MPDQAPEEEVPAADEEVFGGRPLLEQAQDLSRQGLGDALVRVHDQDPRGGHLVHRPVLLGRRAEVLALNDPDPDPGERPRDRERAVRRERIHQQHLVGERQALEALADVGLLVEGGDDRGEAWSQEAA